MSRFSRVEIELVNPDGMVKIADSIILDAENFVKDCP